ncbi:membrane protein insertase YidC [Alkalimarinus sediminis]|uniref:Membrane protein insertase YidC n=1 Tax=Alkalimarinus sediminis TaxID=1632866 RepID=A0A9E8KP40_9ALTE|nr:membrane protein insertase YidC [Alkalimarinus sediminis]UZW75023.1 membrane protein insertase YidC [Alkalimarinus sediminis]
MDAQRGIIFIGLAIVSYLMVLAWNDDYGNQPVTSPSANVATIESSTIASNNSSVTSTDTEFTTPEDLSSSEVGNVSNSSVSNSQKIRIKTDVLDIAIDLTGGNISEALLTQYQKTLGSDEKLALLENSQRHQYTIESGLYGRNGFDASKNGPTPVYQTTQDHFELASDQNELIVDLKYVAESGVEITKRYQFERGNYLVNVSYLVNNNSSELFRTNFSGKIIRDQAADPSQQNSMGMQSFLGMVLSTPAEPYEKFDFEDMYEKPVKVEAKGGWIAFLQHYFLTAWIPANDVEHTYQTKEKNGLYLMGFMSPEVIIEPGQQETISANVFIGPKIIEKLEQAAPNLDLTVDYGFLFFIAYPLYLLLDFLHGIVGNWGIAIILVTVIVKAAFFKLSAASYRSMANMRRVAPKLAQLKEQYGDDRQKMSQGMMELYKKEKINPLGGCLPVLVQMPVFIALYWVLLESVELRHAPFFFWIHDLSIKDPYFILPIIMGASMFIQMSLNPAPPDPVQAKVMKLMPILFTVFFLWFPAGLVLYWVVNNILSIAQQWVITRNIENAAAEKG